MSPAVEQALDSARRTVRSEEEEFTDLGSDVGSEVSEESEEVFIQDDEAVVISDEPEKGSGPKTSEYQSVVAMVKQMEAKHNEQIRQQSEQLSAILQALNKKPESSPSPAAPPRAAVAECPGKSLPPGYVIPRKTSTPAPRAQELSEIPVWPKGDRTSKWLSREDTPEVRSPLLACHAESVRDDASELGSVVDPIKVHRYPTPPRLLAEGQSAYDWDDFGIKVTSKGDESLSSQDEDKFNRITTWANVSAQFLKVEQESVESTSKDPFDMTSVQAQPRLPHLTLSQESLAEGGPRLVVSMFPSPGSCYLLWSGRVTG